MSKAAPARAVVGNGAGPGAGFGDCAATSAESAKEDAARIGVRERRFMIVTVDCWDLRT